MNIKLEQTEKGRLIWYSEKDQCWKDLIDTLEQSELSNQIERAFLYTLQNAIWNEDKATFSHERVAEIEELEAILINQDELTPKNHERERKS